MLTDNNYSFPMTKSTLIFFAYCAFLPWMRAQTSPQRQVITLLPSAAASYQLPEEPDKTALQVAFPFKPKGAFLAFSAVGYGPGAAQLSGKARLQFDSNGIAISHELSAEEHSEPQAQRFVSKLIFLTSPADSFQLWLPATADIDSLRLHFYDPGNTPAPSGPRSTPVHDRSACPCTQPAYQGRTDWCPEGNCPTDPTPVFTVTSFLIVHHSAGSNTASDWAAIVRAIWDFHVNVNGWDDIGYNWLIDPNGVLYEGRGDNRQGAHFCGTNPGTMGVCVLGDFTNIAPQQDALSTLDSLLAWKSCDADLNPLGNGFHASSGLFLQRISGHRDGCATSCPGNAFYPLLPGIRQQVSDFIDIECTPAIPAPTLLSGTLLNAAKALLAWEDNADNETGFELERSVGSNANFELLATLPADSTGFLDTTLSPQTNYHYRVRAMAAGIASAYSNEVVLSTGPSSAQDSDWAPGLLKVIPNPVSSRFSLILERMVVGDIELKLSDAAGRMLTVPSSSASLAGQLSYEMDMTGCPAGVYWLKVTHAGASRVLKLLKVN
jgi:hypothetical protein